MNGLSLGKQLIWSFLVTAVFFLLMGFPGRVMAYGEQTTIAVFVRDNCQHCRDEEVFLKELTEEQGNITVTYYRLERPEKRRVWEELTGRLGIPKVTPITIIGEAYIVGFDDAKTTGEEIRDLVRQAGERGIATDLTSPRLHEAGQLAPSCGEEGTAPCVDNAGQAYGLTLPIVGRIETARYPLVALAAILGFFDGFNPCAMWVLVTFLIILLQVGSRRRMLLFAGTFIAAEAIMYSLILTIWYKTWDFVQLDAVVTPLVGVVAIIGGAFFLRQWRQKEQVCKVTGVEQRVKTRQTIEDLVTQPVTILTVLGIFGLAFSVNVIEFACSIGIPQTFTKILEFNALSFFQTGVLLAIYIFFYMFDDFVVFAMALYGAEKLHLTTTYSRLVNLIGGVVMMLLGMLLIVRPTLFRF